ncbi:MAG: SseB family protein [Pseudomonadota bacterium]
MTDDDTRDEDARKDGALNDQALNHQALDEEAEDDHPETRIDAAWRAAQEAPDSDDVAAARFLDIVLAEALLCPVWEESHEDDDGADALDGASGGEAERGEVAPKMLEIDGRDTLLLFDSEERLAAFSSDPTAFIALPGRNFFEMMAGQGAQIALNLEVAPSATLFGPETVDALAELAASAGEEIDLDPSAPLIVSAPTAAPTPLVAALAARLNAARDMIAEAWLAEFSEEDPGSEGAPGPGRRLALCLRLPEGVDPEEGRDLAMELGRLGASFLEDSALDVALIRADDPILDAVRSEGFGLIRTAS